jgi:hypothetical protein
MGMSFFVIILVSMYLASPIYVYGFDYMACKTAVQNGSFGMNGTTDQHGNPLHGENLSMIAGYLYPYCVLNCGSDFTLNEYNVIAEQASIWFLPWFLLVSQIPCYTENRLHDILVMVLTIGSPTTALYSLFLTVLDRKWLKSICDVIRKRHHANKEAKTKLDNICEVLGGFHQFPMEIESGGLLACTLAGNHNKDWWKRIAAWFEGRRRQMEPSDYGQLGLTILIYGLAVLPTSFVNITSGGTTSTCMQKPVLTYR